MWSSRLVTDYFDIVTVRVEHKGSVVMLVIMRPVAGSAVVAPSRGKGRLIKRVDERSASHTESNVHVGLVRGSRADPEIGFRGLAESGDVRASRHRPGKLHQQGITDGLQRRAVKRLAGFEVTHRNASMVDHGWILWWKADCAWKPGIKAASS